MSFHPQPEPTPIWTLLKQELDSGDVHVLHGQEYYDHREEFVTVGEFEQEIDRYAQEIELPVNQPDDVVGNVFFLHSDSINFQLFL